MAIPLLITRGLGSTIIVLGGLLLYYEIFKWGLKELRGWRNSLAAWWRKLRAGKLL